MRHFRYFAISRREQNEVDDFSKSTSRLKSTNRDSSTNIQVVIYSIGQPEIECNTIQGDQSKPGHSQTQILKENII